MRLACILFATSLILPAALFAQELPAGSADETTPASGDSAAAGAITPTTEHQPDDVAVPRDVDLPTPDDSKPIDLLPSSASSQPASAQGPGEIIPPKGTTPLSDFADTRLSFSLSDDDFLAGPGDTRPNSPSIDFAARRANKLFFENLNRRDSGQETLTHVVVYRHFPGYFKGIDTEAAVVMRFDLFAQDETGKRGQSFYDDGTYIKLGWFPTGTVASKEPNLTITMFPFDTNRFKLGYLYDITWGGPNIFPAKDVTAPGAKLQFNWGPFYLFTGAKTARMLDESINEIQAYWGTLNGVGIDIVDMLNLELGGGYFDRGTNPLTGVEGQPVNGYGVSTRAVFHYGTGPGSSVDFRLYKTDPAATDLFLQNKEFNAKFSAYAALEYTYLQQTLQDGNPGRLSSLAPQGANAAAFSTKLQLWYFDLGADVIYRDLAFVLFNRPSFVPFQAFPDAVKLEPEFMFALSGAAHIPPARTTLALVFGMQLPSTFTGLLPASLKTDDLPDSAGSTTVVVRNANSVDILPCKSYDDPTKADRVCTESYTRSPIWALRGAAKFDVSPMLSLVAETTLMIDNNQTDIVDDEEGLATRSFVTTGDLGFPLRFGAGIFAQAKF